MSRGQHREMGMSPFSPHFEQRNIMSMPSTQRGMEMPPTQRGMTQPQRIGMPSQGRGMPPQGRGMPPQGRGMPPQGRGMPPQGREMQMIREIPMQKQMPTADNYPSSSTMGNGGSNKQLSNKEEDYKHYILYVISNNKACNLAHKMIIQMPDVQVKNLNDIPRSRWPPYVTGAPVFVDKLHNTIYKGSDALRYIKQIQKDDLFITSDTSSSNIGFDATMSYDMYAFEEPDEAGCEDICMIDETSKYSEQNDKKYDIEKLTNFRNNQDNRNKSLLEHQNVFRGHSSVSQSGGHSSESQSGGQSIRSQSNGSSRGTVISEDFPHF